MAKKKHHAKRKARRHSNPRSYGGWVSLGYRVGKRGRFGDDYAAAFRAQRGRPPKDAPLGRQVDAKEGFYEGFNRARTDLAARHSNPTRRAKFGRWYRHPKGVRVRLRRHRGQLVLDVRK